MWSNSLCNCVEERGGETKATHLTNKKTFDPQGSLLCFVLLVLLLFFLLFLDGGNPTGRQYSPDQGQGYQDDKLANDEHGKE
jgi:hypothetical protein